jgi:ketosteroid isomerase-like protein
MTRTTQQVFDSHRDAIETGDFERLIADYADDANLLTLDGAFVGKEGVASFFAGAFESFPGLRISFEKTAVEGDTFLLQWSAECDVGTFPHGVAAFIIREGKIQRQAEWFIFVPKEG